jgi:hypothetical protein
MPTAAKLIAAIAFAVLAYVVAEIYKTTVPERTVWGAFSPISAGIGLLCGWFVMGRLAGQGYRAAAGYGLRTMVTATFWVVTAFAIYLMILRSMNMRYDGPMEALLGAVDIGLELGRSLATSEVLGTLAVGGVVAGALTEWVGRRWP